MVQQHPETGLEGFDVRDNVLLHDGREIARFPTAICELARLNNQLFVVLHPYPIDEHPDYAGENLWSLNLSGRLLWKARNLNEGQWPSARSRFYAGLRLFDIDEPKISVGTGEDRLTPIINIHTGEHIPHDDQSPEAARIPKQVFAKSKIFLWALPCEPPSESKPDMPSPT